MRKIRNLMFAVLIVVAAFGWGRGVLGATGRTYHLCTSQPMCGDLQSVECSQWPQDGCYLFGDTSEIDEETAQTTCEAWMKCGWAVMAESQGDCWWCQFELAKGASCSERP
jgi:hypothetical protein